MGVKSYGFLFYRKPMEEIILFIFLAFILVGIIIGNNITKKNRKIMQQEMEDEE